MDTNIGNMLDNRYELLEVVGSGGMAVVYRAKDHRLNRFVAVKILKPEAAADPDLLRRFRTEAQAVAMLSHPNVVDVYDVGSYNGMEFIVMELIDGITLKEYMNQQPGNRLPWKEALHFITQIMRALRHAHSRGIVHRDIKPQNVMVLRDGSAKVADFGIAHLESSQHTRTQETLGSVHYISPEQAKGEKVDARTDIYSAGVVLYEMLTGTLPYRGETAVSIALQHINSVPTPPGEIVPDLPAGLEQITLKAMTADLGTRYPTAKSMLDDLDAFRKNPAIVFAYSIPGLKEASPAKKDPFDEFLMPEEKAKVQREPRQEKKEKLPPTDRKDPRISNSGRSEKGKNGTPKKPSKTRAERERERQRQEEERRKKHRRNVLITVLVLAMLILLFVAGIIVSRVLVNAAAAPKTYVAPQLVNMDYNEAMKTYGDEFDIQVSTYVETEEKAAGTVLTQTPDAGTIFEGDNRTIYVTVAIGSDFFAMPDVVDYNEVDAVNALLDAGVPAANIVKGEAMYSADIPEGCVVYTDPTSGTPIDDTVTVTYYLSKGSEPVVVPNFVGMLRSDVTEELRELGLNGLFEVVDSDKPAGTILTQDVAEGTEVNPGDKILFTYSSGSGEDELSQPDEDEEKTDQSKNSADYGYGSGNSNSGSAAATTTSVTVPMSGYTDRSSVSVEVQVDGVTQYTNTITPSEQDSVGVDVEGTAGQTVEVYVDGVLVSDYNPWG